MRPIERLEETYFPKDIKLLEYMEEVAVLYVPDYAIDHETGEQYLSLIHIFKHLLAEIREIRLSERRFYQKLTDIYATAIDYPRKQDRNRIRSGRRLLCHILAYERRCV